MNWVRWGRVVFGGFLVLISPWVGSGVAQVKAVSQPVEGGEVSNPGRGPRKFRTTEELQRFLEDHAGSLKAAEVDKAIWRLLVLKKKTSTLSPAGGGVGPDMNYLAISARFGRYASEPVAGYLRIMAREEAWHYAKDGRLLISPDTLGRRIAAIEKFLAENRRFPRRNQLIHLAQKYLIAYFLGLDNTSAFLDGTNRLNWVFLQSYRNLLAESPGSSFAVTIRGYLDTLEKNDFHKTKAVIDFVNKISIDFLT